MIPVLALVAALVWAAENLDREWQVYRFDQSAREDLGPPGRLPVASEVPARAALALALLNARGALYLPAGDDRAETIRIAKTFLERAQAARPLWGEADVAATFLAFVEFGAAAPATQHAFARSYRRAPYLETSATWRIRYGMMVLPDLSDDSRRAMLSEASWISSWSHRHYALVSSIAGPAHAAILKKARAEYGRAVGLR